MVSAYFLKPRINKEMDIHERDKKPIPVTTNNNLLLVYSFMELSKKSKLNKAIARAIPKLCFLVICLCTTFLLQNLIQFVQLSKTCAFAYMRQSDLYIPVILSLQ